MKHKDIKNKQARAAVQKLEQRRFILKTIIKNTNLFYLTRWKAFFKLRSLPKISSKTLITNRCIVSSRRKRLNKIINVSRLVFLSFARLAEINGVKKYVG